MSDFAIFLVSRSSDGEREWFSARDPAAGVVIPAESRDQANALVSSLNMAFSHHLRTALSEAEKREREASAKALGDAAEAIFVMGAWSPKYDKLTPNTFDEGTSAAYEIVRELQGKAESDLQAQEG